MADIITSIADPSGFLPAIWAQEALRVLRANLVLTMRVARDVDYTPAYRGKSLTIGYPGTFSTVDKAEDTPVSPETPVGGTSVTVTLDHHVVVPFSIENFVDAQANLPLMQRYLEPATIAIAERVESDLWGLVGGLSTSIGTPGTAVDYPLVLEARQDLNIARSPMSERTLAVSPTSETALLSDTNLSNFFAFGAYRDSGESIPNGSIGRLAGFEVVMSQLAPVGTGPTSSTNVAFHRSAFLLAMRPFLPVPDGTGVLSATAVDADSGLAIRISSQYDINAISMRCNLDVLYGLTILRDTLGINVQGN